MAATVMPASDAMKADIQQFKLWQPGVLDAVRHFLLSERFQSATQLAAGVLFVSLFVFVDALRFPASCVAILLYFVVAVTAAPDCHVGTRIFLCGFMMGPMWLSLLLGGTISTLGKLAPTREGELIILCVLGPLVLIPFAINRMGTRHLYLFAMGMVSCLYLGMPILTGWGAPSITVLWERAVGFVLVAALIGMFAGSVLSFIVLPSLASHKLEEDVSTALTYLGQHLSSRASLLWRPGKTSLQGLPRHLEGLHPLLLQQTTQTSQPCQVAPGLLDRDVGAAPVSPRQIYVAALDWFEHLSRPPPDPAAGAKACLTGCRSTSISESQRSERVKSTFYGPSSSAMAAAVAAAAQDSEEEQQWQQQLQEQSDQLPAQRNRSWAGSNPNNSSSSARNSFAWRQHSVPAAGPLAAVAHDPLQLRLGSTVTAATVKDAKVELQCAESRLTAEGRPVSSGGNLYSGPSSRALGREQPCPSISAVRQLLAHAYQLLQAAGTEPQWLRAGERRYQPAAWTKMVAASQLVALRMTALDIIQHEFVSLSEETNSFPVADELSQLLRQLYGSAAAALAMIAEQVRCRQQLTAVCAANQHILKHPSWCAARLQLLQLLEGTLVHYFVSIQQASPEQPVTLPSAHWVRRWMFFHTTTLSLLDSLDGLADAAEAALTTIPQQQSTHWWQRRRSSSASGHQDRSGQKQQQVGRAPGRMAGDIEAGAKLSSPRQQQQQATELQLQPSSMYSSSYSANGLGRKPSPAVLGSWVPERRGNQDAAAAADAAIRFTAHHQQHQHQQQQVSGTQPVAVASAGCAPQTQSAGSPQQPTPAAAAAAAGGKADHEAGGMKASFMRHTAWIRPWLPLALNLEQYGNLKIVFTEDIPNALSSKKAFAAALRNRRVHAAVKYWCVLVVMMVGTLLLQYFVPVSARLNPSFGYTAAVVGMSDRVESTVFKIFLWTGATVVGATLGWALMSHPSMALNSVALGAVMCTVAFAVGTLERGPAKSSSLFTLFSITTLASIVLCQCCGAVGNTWVSLTRGASVIVAAVVALAVQNLVLPWYTSTWALEQLGLVYKEATDVLADLVCQLYEETEQLLQQQQLLHVTADDPAAAAAAAAAAVAAAGDVGSNAACGSETAGEAGEDTTGDSIGKGTQQSPLQRLQLLDEAVKRVWEKEQQQQQQQSTGGADCRVPSQQQQQAQGQQQGSRQASFISTVAAARLASIGRMFNGSSHLEHLLQPSATGISACGATVRQGVAASATSTSQAGGEEAVAAAAAVKSALADSVAAAGEAAVCEMVQLLQRRRQKYRQLNQQHPGGEQHHEGGVSAGAGRVAVTGLQLQARLVRPLVQVKISLVLDTTAWKSGPLTTPQLVLRMHAAMFELVDALAALQQAVAMPVTKVNGSWDWTLMHTAGALGALLLQAMQLAEATSAHVLGATADTTQTLLAQIQEVQHKRFEYFAVQRELRRLLHMALATDKEVAQSHLAGINEWQLQGHLRYSACVYAIGKVLDRVTAAARCALSEFKCG